MIRLGEKQSLTVVKQVEFGVYLAEREGDETRVLLPARQVPEGTQIVHGKRLLRLHPFWQNHLSGPRFHRQPGKKFIGVRHLLRHPDRLFRKAAVYGDMIYPYAIQGENKITVNLADAQGNPYAVIELEEKV